MDDQFVHLIRLLSEQDKDALLDELLLRADRLIIARPYLSLNPKTGALRRRPVATLICVSENN